MTAAVWSIVGILVVILIALIAVSFLTRWRGWAVFIPPVILAIDVLKIHSAWLLGLMIVFTILGFVAYFLWERRPDIPPFVALLAIIVAVIVTPIALTQNHGETQTPATSTTVAASTTSTGATDTTAGNTSTTAANTETTEGPTPGPATGNGLASPETWLMAYSDYAHNRWVSNGVSAIYDAKTNQEARDAANTWLDQVKNDPVLLSAAIGYFLNIDVAQESLVDPDHNASLLAVKYTAELGFLFSQATITAGNAPVNGWNSGVKTANGGAQVVVAQTNNITGNRKAVKILLPKGTKIIYPDGSVFVIPEDGCWWIMSRCGNVVTPGKPKPTTTTVPGSTTTTCPSTSTTQPGSTTTSSSTTSTTVKPTTTTTCKPTTTTTVRPTTTTTCKPTTTTLKPKSPNPTDYPYPPGKPSVPTVTTPPETSPPPVASSTTTSLKAPGASTTTTAKNAPTTTTTGSEAGGGTDDPGNPF